MARSTAALRRRLADCRELVDLPPLLAALGFEEAWDSFPAAAFLGQRTELDDSGGMAIVARRGAFLWYGVVGVGDTWPRRLLRRLRGRGEIAGVVGLDGAAGRLTIGVAFGDLPLVQLDLREPDPGLLKHIDRICDIREGKRLALAARLADLLGAEGIGRRFFRRFASLLAAFTEALAGSTPEAAARELALLQLTRVLFLYFVQARGWLDGRADFLAGEVAHCLSRRGSLQRHLLAPLFFGTLNRPAAERSPAARTFGRIPFLNGGLFEPHPLERRHRVLLPNTLWRSAFDDVFERFRFTAAENDPGDAIAPDMLGRVFEGLMEPSGRKASGTFYTPAALVRRVIAHTFAAWIAGRRSCSRREAHRLLDARDPCLAPLWRDVTVLDPAVGSGAFLLGALEFLAERGAGTGAVVKRAILERHLFGVDKDATAVRLAELRLWLAVLADDAEGRPESVRPLPNLDCLVRQGDSLFDPWWKMGGRLGAARAGADLSDLRRRVVVSPGAEKSDAIRALHAAEAVVARELLDRSEQRLEDTIRGCLQEARDLDLFGRPRGMGRELRRRLAAAREQRREVRRQRRALERHRELPWFHYECQFGDVFAHRGGFDLVVGNPPWVRAEELPSEERSRLRERYRWWRGVEPRGGGAGYGHQPDLAMAFLERAVELAAPEGAFGLLLPRKVTAAGYATAAREALVTTTTLDVVADLTDSPLATFEATTYPLALIGRKARPAPAHTFVTSLDQPERDAVPQAALSTRGPWILSHSSIRGALDEVADLPVLVDSVRCQLGVKTGANAVFLDPSADVEPELLRWAIRGRDIRPWRARRRRRVIWTHGPDGQPLARLPRRARDFFARHRESLERRSDYRGGPYWRMFRTIPAAAAALVAWADLAAGLAAIPLVRRSDRRSIALNTCYVAACRRRSTALALAAWLNSTPIRTIAKARADVARGGYARFNATVVGHVPLPPDVLHDDLLVALSRAALLGENVQARLDDRVVVHLRLSAAGRRAMCLVS